MITYCLGLFLKLKFHALDGGMAQWTSLPPQEEMARVRIPPGYKVFKENITMLMCIVNFCSMHCLCVEKEIYRCRPKNILKLNFT
jgi:hypothetical protein